MHSHHSCYAALVEDAGAQHGPALGSDDSVRVRMLWERRVYHAALAIGLPLAAVVVYLRASGPPFERVTYAVLAILCSWLLLRRVYRAVRMGHRAEMEELRAGPTSWR